MIGSLSARDMLTLGIALVIYDASTGSAIDSSRRAIIWDPIVAGHVSKTLF